MRDLFQQSKDSEIDNLQKEVVNIEIPHNISNEENIARFIFSPINVDIKNNSLKANCFKPPVGFDEVSVNRFNYTDANFLKKMGLRMQNPKKVFYGLLNFQAINVRKNDFEIIFTPIINENPYHSDIKIGYIVERDVPLPAEINACIKRILRNTQLFKDTNTEKSHWDGDEIKLY